MLFRSQRPRDPGPIVFAEFGHSGDNLVDVLLGYLVDVEDGLSPSAITGSGYATQVDDYLDQPFEWLRPHSIGDAFG